jgi:hypothetical protein
LRSTSAWARLGARRALADAGGETQALQAAQAVDQVGDRLAEAGGELIRSVLDVVRHREEQRGEARVEVELERGRHQRHAEGVLPDRLAGAERRRAIEFGGEVGGPDERIARLGRQPLGKQLERRLVGAGLGRWNG